MLSPSMFCASIAELRKQLLARRQRGLVVLKGELAWSNALVASLLTEIDTNDMAANSQGVIAYGVQFSAQPALIVSNYRHHLGTENSLLFFADNGFHPDAFAALSGTLAAGGLMIWLCPPTLVDDSADLFMQRFWQQIVADQYALILQQGEPAFPDFQMTTQTNQLNDLVFTEQGCLTQEQLLAVNAIEKVATGHRKRPLVLTADRGRGKSSALAIAVANLFNTYDTHAQLTILITAPHSDAVKVFFAQLHKSCPAGTQEGERFRFEQHQVQFVAIDNIVNEWPKAHLLLVDEAAAIPVYLLSRLLDNYPRMVFSSTVHGYEGAGRGFAIKFKQILAKKTPQFKQYHIRQPIRWREHDPLEQLIFTGFLLSSNLDDPHVDNRQNDKLTVETKLVSQRQLFADEVLLRQVFRVLISAHYQTKPSDLKLLLTNAALRIFVSFDGEQVIAVALTIVEGLADDRSVTQIEQSIKRLKDQFLPQSLYLHCHCQQAFELQYLRIMRIAVVEHCQQQGIGLALLETIKNYAIAEKIAMLGTSFGANASLLSFWAKAKYHVVRIGLTRDHASGEHSALLLQALTPDGQALFNQVQRQFYRQFAFLLSEQFQSLSATVVQVVIQQWPKALRPQCSEFDLQVVEHFINKRSGYDNCVFSLHLWLINTLAQQAVNSELVTLLVTRILQKQPLEYLGHHLGYTGKKQINAALINGVAQLRLTQIID